MADIHQVLRGCTFSVRLVPILEDAVRAHGIRAVMEVLGVICEARAQDGLDRREDWAAARDHLCSFVYPERIGEQRPHEDS
jgi:hypothetical protein